MSAHRPYYVTLAGLSICIGCSDREGYGVPWETAESVQHDAFLLRENPLGK